MVAGQLHCDYKEHSPGNELHPAAGATQQACLTHLTGLRWVPSLTSVFLRENSPSGCQGLCDQTGKQAPCCRIAVGNM